MQASGTAGMDLQGRNGRYVIGLSPSHDLLDVGQGAPGISYANRAALTKEMALCVNIYQYLSMRWFLG